MNFTSESNLTKQSEKALGAAQSAADWIETALMESYEFLQLRRSPQRIFRGWERQIEDNLVTIPAK